MPRFAALPGPPLRCVAALLTGLTACDTLVDCTTEARASVQLTVVDSSGAPISGAHAEYTIEGESWPAPQPCEDSGDGSLICGWEVEDTFHIEVSADGFLSQSVEVDVWADECHVQTELVTVELIPA